MAPGMKKGHIPPPIKNKYPEILIYPSNVLRSNLDIQSPSESEVKDTYK